MLRDCFFVFLKLVENNLYLQLMEYEHLEESRTLLVFLDLVYEYVSSSERASRFESDNFHDCSEMSQNISVFAASVISKVTTLLQSDRNFNLQIVC